MADQERIDSAEAVRQLDLVQSGDKERAHIQADSILLSAVDPEVREAYGRVLSRDLDWWYA